MSKNKTAMRNVFHFGRNWTNYVKKVVNEKVIEEAKKSLLEYLPSECYEGKTFIDIGFGSGIFSLAATLLGCKKVISFDSDAQNLIAMEILRKRFEPTIPHNVAWIVFQGNILDETLVNKLTNTGDIVYSWGVLHHTGNMWQAIRNATRLTKENGYFIIAIYNDAPTSQAWQKIKEFYNRHLLIQPILGTIYGCFVCAGYMIKNKTLNLYRKRGMHVFYDAIDWLGGYPYEFASFLEVKNFIEKLGFTLIKSPTKLPSYKNEKITLIDILRAKYTGCNEFVFLKS